MMKAGVTAEGRLNLTRQ